jgi:hypothetical protein
MAKTESKEACTLDELLLELYPAALIDAIGCLEVLGSDEVDILNPLRTSNGSSPTQEGTQGS